MKILVTGATGFIGKALCETLRKGGFDLRAAVRQKNNKMPCDCEIVEIGDIGPQTDWQKALAGIDIVIHLAGQTHILKDTVDNSLTAFRKVNVLGTERLARMAAKAGVKRFIFISSVKVNGDGLGIASAPAAPRNDGGGAPYTERDTPVPQDAYGISKREAEDSLACIAAETGLQVVVWGEG